MQNNIVLVGIGGAGVSAIAGILLELGYENIVGIDGFHSQLTDELDKKGVKIIYGHGNYEIKGGDVVIYSEAAVNSPEVIQAKELQKTYKRGMLVCNYFQFLGEISKYFKTLGLTGTNGKSTSTALSIYAAKNKVKDFSIGVVGALMSDLNNKNFFVAEDKTQEIRNIFDHIFTGKGLDYELIKKYIFIVEACEYKRHFLHLDLDVACISSIELDHTDYYKDMGDYIDAYKQMIRKTKNKIFLAPGLDKEWIDEDIRDKCFETNLNNYKLNNVFGEFYDMNISMIKPAIESIANIKLDDNDWSEFHGLWRRMEKIGTNSYGSIIFSDYAHIPSSVRGAYHSLKKQFPDKKILGIFQPHQVNRVIEMWDDFLDAMKLFDEAMLYKIYSAREDADKIYQYKGKQSGTIQQIGEYMASRIGCDYEINVENIIEKTKQAPNDLIIVIMTAGDLDYEVRKSIK